MESKGEMSSGGVAVRGYDAPQGFQVAARASENPTTQLEVPTMAAFQPVNVAVPTPTSTAEVKKKRGRPRKYGPDGTVTAALSPMPISASIPLSGDFSAWKQQTTTTTTTTTKVKPFQAVKKPQKLEFESTGDQRVFLPGTNFTPHVITVNAGEDIAMKVMSFSQQDSRAVCVLSASGSVSNVTLRQPNSSWGTLTYEGRFEILSLSGSFMPTDNGVLKSRSGGLSVSLAGPDGRVLGGGLAGLFIAASPVQVVIGSFVPGNQPEQKAKKPRMEALSAPIPTVVPPPHNKEAIEGSSGYEGQMLSFTSPLSNNVDPLASLNSTQDSKDADTENDLSSSPEGESNEDSPLGFEI